MLRIRLTLSIGESVIRSTSSLGRGIITLNGRRRLILVTSRQLGVRLLTVTLRVGVLVESRCRILRGSFLRMATAHGTFLSEGIVSNA